MATTPPTTPLLFEQGSTNGQGVQVYDQAGTTKRYVKIDARGIGYLNIQTDSYYLRLLGHGPPQAAEYVPRQINGEVIIIVNNHRTSAFPTQNPTQGNPVGDAPHLRTIHDHITIQTHRDARPFALTMLLTTAPMCNPIDLLGEALEKLKDLASATHDMLPDDEVLILAIQQYNTSTDIYNVEVMNTTRTFPANPLSAREAWARVGNRRRYRLLQLRRHWQGLITAVRTQLNFIRSAASTPQLAEAIGEQLADLADAEVTMNLVCEAFARCWFE